MNEESKTKTFFKYEKNNSTTTNGTIEKSVKIRNTIKNPSSNNLKRLSCEELENLKERFVDFIKLDQEQEEVTNSQMNIINQLPSPPLPPLPSPPQPPPPPPSQCQHLTLKSSTNKQSRLSIMSCDSSSAESSTSSTSCNSKPEPPQRTVSIRNSTCNIYSSSSILNDLKQSDDLISIKSSSIYSSCRGSLLNQTQSILPVRSSRSVFSIYEEEDENSSAISSNSSSSKSSTSSTSSNSSLKINANKKLERIKDYEIQKIESMYRSIGSIVNVSQSTCDLMSTTSEQIANLLNDCWKLEISSVVPVWIFDTGYNPKRVKQLRLIFVHRTTGFPLVKQNILIDETNQIKNPNNDKRLTFTLKNNQLVCLIKFYDYFSCQEFYKFYIDLVNNTRNTDLFGRMCQSQSITKLNQTNMAKIHSRSMISLSKLSNEKCVNNNQKKKIINVNKNRRKRYSEMICLDNDEYNNNKANDIDVSISNKNKQMITTITKHCISNPCAFQHINSLKNNDQYVQEFIGDTCDNNNKMNLIVNSISSNKSNDTKLHYNYFFKSNNDQVQKKVLK